MYVCVYVCARARLCVCVCVCGGGSERERESAVLVNDAGICRSRAQKSYLLFIV